MLKQKFLAAAAMLAVVGIVPSAQAGSGVSKAAWEACKSSAQEAHGEAYSVLDRRVKKGSRSFEVWVANAENAEDRVYCKYSVKKDKVVTLEKLAAGEFRPSK